MVYDIAEIDFARLDRSEGYRPGRPAQDNDCVRAQRHVLREGNEHEPILVWLYLASRVAHSLMPDSAYKGLMVEAARFWHLPADYAEHLRSIEVV